jgi:hypothetical protein
MADRLGYVIVTFHPGGQPGLTTGASLYTDRWSAVEECDRERADTARNGRRERYVIAEVTELGEGGESAP